MAQTAILVGNPSGTGASLSLRKRLTGVMINPTRSTPMLVTTPGKTPERWATTQAAAGAASMVGATGGAATAGRVTVAVSTTAGWVAVRAGGEDTAVGTRTPTHSLTGQKRKKTPTNGITLVWD